MPESQTRSVSLPTGLALSLLWASLMGLYIYNDYFNLYAPGTIEHMMAGKIEPLGTATNGIMMAVSIMLAIPSLMIFLSAALPHVISRWLNLVLGVVYTAVEVMTLRGPRPSYTMVVVLEILITLTIIVYAVRWTRPAARAPQDVVVARPGA